ncbi:MULTISPECIES: hypothetical protein [unclassified Streptomyces]|uniref:hypothetical protein n=1 Tax=unclassified Streptomyces TaxID=2593676 RepID=UPI001FD819C2|nr:hypothetical protein [Streptomyces sp. NEAU-H3]
MSVRQYRAVSGSGRVDDPSEEVLFRMVSGLEGARSGFVVLAPEEPDPRWWAAVSRLGDGRYEVVRRERLRGGPEISVTRDAQGLVRELTGWAGARGAVRSGSSS